VQNIQDHINKLHPSLKITSKKHTLWFQVSFAPKNGIKPSTVLAIMQPLLAAQKPGQEYMSCTMDAEKVHVAVKVESKYMFNLDDCSEFLAYLT
jgi:hypothetical protein